jgi:hypothetical protein
MFFFVFFHRQVPFINEQWILSVGEFSISILLTTLYTVQLTVFSSTLMTGAIFYYSLHILHSSSSPSLPPLMVLFGDDVMIDLHQLFTNVE